MGWLAEQRPAVHGELSQCAPVIENTGQHGCLHAVAKHLCVSCLSLLHAPLGARGEGLML